LSRWEQGCCVYRVGCASCTRLLLQSISTTTTTLVWRRFWWLVPNPTACSPTNIHSSGVRCCLGYSRHSRISWYQSPESRIGANRKRHDAGPQLHCPITATLTECTF
jgi:hypothetical protein